MNKVLKVILVTFLLLSLTACSGGEFKIEGKWKNVGDTVFAQVRTGTIVNFDGEKCAIYSPYSSYWVQYLETDR